MMKEKVMKHMDVLLPFIILLAMLLIFTVTTGGSIFSGSNLMLILKQTLNVIIAALGMVFVASLGGTDITQGSLVGFAGACGTVAALNYGLAAAVVAAVIAGLLSGLFLGVVNARFKVPSFMCSLAMMIALRAMATVAMGGSSSGLKVPEFIINLDNNSVKIPIVIILIVIVWYVFNYTPFGAYCRGIGENENAVKFAGVPVTKIKIIAFGLSGLFTGIASVFVLARVGGCSTTLGLGFEMRVMMAMFIGGIPVEGRSGTRLYKMIVGAFMITLLENGLVLTGSSGSITQLIRGIVLLAVVYITIISKKMVSRVRVDAAKKA